MFFLLVRAFRFSAAGLGEMHQLQHKTNKKLIMNSAPVKTKPGQIEFGGWSLDSCSFNGEFDEAARERMIKGGRLLLSYIHEYKARLGKYLLEIGPFYNPLLSREQLEPEQRLAFWENDAHALKWLKEAHLCNQIFPVACDINDIGKIEFQFSSCPIFVEAQELKVYSGKYDSIIMSQIFNYINYKNFISQIRRFINPGGLLFINNVIDYGIPEFFADARPKSREEIIQVLEDNDFKVLDKELLPPPRSGDDERLLLVASYQGSTPVFL